MQIQELCLTNLTWNERTTHAKTKTNKEYQLDP